MSLSHAWKAGLVSGCADDMGWAFFRHRQDPARVTEVTELYVWPTFRRLGIGTWLETFCVREAAGRGSAEIHLILNEADSVLPLRRAGQDVRGSPGLLATVEGHSGTPSSGNLDQTPARDQSGYVSSKIPLPRGHALREGVRGVVVATGRRIASRDSSLTA